MSGGPKADPVQALVDALVYGIGFHIAPSVANDIFRIAPLPELTVGDRVWCYPGTDHGFETTVTKVRNAISGRNRKVYETASGRTFEDHEIALFDVNHNQKRAYARGKRIEARIAPTRYTPAGIHRWHYVEHPIWSDRCEYRVQPPKAERDYSVGLTFPNHAIIPFVKRVDPYAEVRAAYAAGKKLEVRLYADWELWCVDGRGDGCPAFSSEPENYRVAVPFRAEREAFAAGKTIQCRNVAGGFPKWIDCSPGWVDGVEYRVKPEPVVVRTEQVVRVKVKTTPLAIHFGDVTLDVTTTDGEVTNVTVKDF